MNHITVYEFGVVLGGSAVPYRIGPSVGRTCTPLQVWSTTLDKVQLCGDLALTRPGVAIDHEQNEPVGRSECFEQRKRRVQRARRVRWLKPLERVTMLTNAGCSEDRIYRLMKESSDIAISRRLCVMLQRHMAAIRYACADK